MKKLSETNETNPEVLESCARQWSDEGENRETGAILLSDGDWVLIWVSGEGESQRQTTVRLSPLAALATICVINDVMEKTGKPLGWSPSQF